MLSNVFEKKDHFVKPFFILLLVKLKIPAQQDYMHHRFSYFAKADIVGLRYDSFSAVLSEQ